MTTFDKMRESTRATILEALGDGGWHPSKAVAKAAGLQPRIVREHLSVLRGRGDVEMAELPSRSCTGSGFTLPVWRRLPPGSVEPLYPSTPNCDPRPLAMCWGGYSYVTKGASPCP